MDADYIELNVGFPVSRLRNCSDIRDVSFLSQQILRDRISPAERAALEFEIHQLFRL